MVEVHLEGLEGFATVRAWRATQVAKELEVRVLTSADSGDFRHAISRVVSDIRGSLIPRVNHVEGIERLF